MLQLGSYPSRKIHYEERNLALLVRMQHPFSVALQRFCAATIAARP